MAGIDNNGAPKASIKDRVLNWGLARTKMGWAKTASVAFVVTALLESMVDKTQIGNIGMATAARGRGDSVKAVFTGSLIAMVATTLLETWVGSRFGDRLPKKLMERASGAVFCLLGAWTLWASFTDKEPMLPLEPESPVDRVDLNEPATVAAH